MVPTDEMRGAPPINRAPHWTPSYATRVQAQVPSLEI